VNPVRGKRIIGRMGGMGRLSSVTLSYSPFPNTNSPHLFPITHSPLYPFTAPTVSPLTICFWKMKKMMIMGIAETDAPAMMSP
jgi:hypothetical protein